MLWPALQVRAHGELTAAQLHDLLTVLDLQEVPRTEGPGAGSSIAHRSLTDDTGSRLVLDLGRLGDTGWTLRLFFDTTSLSAPAIDTYRSLWRQACEQFGLRIVDVEPAHSADDVFVMPSSPSEAPASGVGYSWDLPYADLDNMWPHVGLRKDAPQDVKAVKLREVMRTPVWSAAPESLRRQADLFLQDSGTVDENR